MLIVALARLRPFGLLKPGLAILLCIGPSLLSLVVNSGAAKDAIPIMALGILVLVAYVFGLASDEQEFRNIAVRAAALSVALFFVAITANKLNLFAAIRSGTRISLPEMHPNLFGLTAMTIFLLAAFSRSWLFVAAMLAVTMVACLACSSRSSILTIITILVASRALVLRRGVALIGAAALAALVTTAAVLFFGDLLGGIARAVFHFDDPYRGATSGGSGRPLIWRFYIQNWLVHPLLGSGPGTTFQMNGDNLYTHNMVLQILTNSGMIGLLAFVALLLWIVVATRTSQIGAEWNRYVLTIIAAYMVYGLFEGRAINVGNPISAVFFFVLFAGLARSNPTARAARSNLTTIEAQRRSDLSVLRAGG
jgi:O-antigen ligase